MRKKVEGTPERPRLVVYRSLKHIYAQLVDDAREPHASLTVSDLTVGEGKKAEKCGRGRESAGASGRRRRGSPSVVFDRAGYQYHGRVKAVADGAREGGLEF